LNKNNHTKQLLLFKDIGGKKVEADFQGGEVSSDAVYRASLSIGTEK